MKAAALGKPGTVFLSGVWRIMWGTIFFHHKKRHPKVIKGA
jgi:hypothetical protein